MCLLLQRLFPFLLCFPCGGALGVIDFEKELWPILLERCVECHKAPFEQAGRLKEPKAGLRLDGAAHILRGSDDGLVLSANHPSRSSLYTRTILPFDDADHMPPKGDPLTRKQKEIIRKWIAQGADFGTWEGATDGLDELASQSDEAEYIPEHLRFFEELSQGLKPLPKQTLDELSAETGLLVRPIGLGSPLLEVRVVSSAHSVTDKAIKALSPLSRHLAKLDLTGAHLSKQACKWIGSFKTLTHLSLRRSNISDEGLKELRELSSLQNLNLTETKLTDSGADFLVRMTSLQNLYLWQSGISEKKRELLRARLKGVEVTP
jgi:hypothetical protein